MHHKGVHENKTECYKYTPRRTFSVWGIENIRACKVCQTRYTVYYLRMTTEEAFPPIIRLQVKKIEMCANNVYKRLCYMTWFGLKHACNLLKVFEQYLSCFRCTLS